MDSENASQRALISKSQIVMLTLASVREKLRHGMTPSPTLFLMKCLSDVD